MRVLRLATAVSALALPAQAACYADYKAKQDDPLRLHYGVVALDAPACDSLNAAAAAIAGRLGDGWELLQVEGIFGEDGLDERRDGAGEYFLRY